MIFVWHSFLHLPFRGFTWSSCIQNAQNNTCKIVNQYKTLKCSYWHKKIYMNKTKNSKSSKKKSARVLHGQTRVWYANMLWNIIRTLRLKGRNPVLVICPKLVTVLISALNHSGLKCKCAFFNRLTHSSPVNITNV